jgi:heme exporter protein D
MDGLATFLAMGGYAGYVWPAYGLTAIVLVAILVLSLGAARRAARRLAELEAMMPRRRRNASE